jgi:activator of HSP90 ATPase
MTRPIQQSTRFAATPEELFEMYLDSALHSVATGAAAVLSREVGGPFTAWGGALAGRNLLIIPNRVIVQAWRATHWPASDHDSILILRFSGTPGGAQVDLVHENVPEHDHEGVTQGWTKYYWEPWRAHLASRGPAGAPLATPENPAKPAKQSSAKKPARKSRKPAPKKSKPRRK